MHGALLAAGTAVILGTVTGGGTTPQASHAGRPDPDQLAAAYTEAFNARDASALAVLFAEDALLLPPDTPLIEGRSTIEAAYRARFPRVVGRLQMQWIDFDTHGDRATAVGTFTLSRGQRGKPAGEVVGSSTSGKYVVIYERIQGQWLIAFQIMNYDSPQPP